MLKENSFKKGTLVFVDEANVTKAASKNFNKSFNWLEFKDYIINYGNEPRELIEMVVYVGIPPYDGNWQDRINSKRKYIHMLKSFGFLVVEKIGQACGDWYKSNVDVMMAIDTIDMCNRIKPYNVILVTGDSDFAYLATTIRRMGIKVEVASIPETISTDLRNSANSYINLTTLFESFKPYNPYKLPNAA
jgi:uncharacterized LabA/DUF88 family protein